MPKKNRTRITESTGDPGRWVAQYFDPTIKVWFDIGDSVATEAEARKKKIEYDNRDVS